MGSDPGSGLTLALRHCLCKTQGASDPRSEVGEARFCLPRAPGSSAQAGVPELTGGAVRGADHTHLSGLNRGQPLPAGPVCWLGGREDGEAPIAAPT